MGLSTPEISGAGLTAVLAVMLAFAGAKPAWPASVASVELADFARAADAVVVVEVADVQVVTTRWGLARRVVLTIERVWKGDLAPGDRIELEALGGSDGVRETSVPGEATYEPGGRLLLFAERRPDGIWVSVAMGASAIPVNEGGDPQDAIDPVILDMLDATPFSTPSDRDDAR